MLFAIKPSRIYIFLLFAVHLLAVIAVYLTNLPLWVRVCLALLVLLNLSHQLYLHLSARQAWRSLVLDQRRVFVGTQGGMRLTGQVAPRSVVIPFCVVLCVRLDGHRLPVCQVIFRDAMQADAFRELRVRLRFF